MADNESDKNKSQKQEKTLLASAGRDSSIASNQLDSQADPSSLEHKQNMQTLGNQDSLSDLSLKCPDLSHSDRIALENNRFEIIEENKLDFQIARSFTEGLEAIKENSTTAEEFEIKQAQYSIEYMLKKMPVHVLADNPISDGLKHFFRSGMDLVSGSKSVSDFLTERPALESAAKKSHSLKELLSKDVPWLNKLVVNYKWEGEYSHFDLRKFEISMLKGWNDQKLVETFAHELFHAKHQDIDKLYAGAKLDRAEYAKLKISQEAGAFLQEYKVHKELQGMFKNPKDSSFEIIQGDGTISKIPISKLIVETGGKIDDIASRKKIAEFLLTHDSPQQLSDGTYQKNDDGSFISNSYKKLYEGFHYQNYLETFDQMKSTLKPYLNKGF